MCHRWWRRGERAPGTRQIGYQWAYIFSAVRPDTGDDVTLVMPSVNAKVMDLFLAHFADTPESSAGFSQPRTTQRGKNARRRKRNSTTMLSATLKSAKRPSKKSARPTRDPGDEAWACSGLALDATDRDKDTLYHPLEGCVVVGDHCCPVN